MANKKPLFSQKSGSPISQNSSKPILRMKLANAYEGLTLETFPMLAEIFNEKYQVIIDNDNFDVVINLPYRNEPVDYKNAVRLYYTGEVVILKRDSKTEVELIKINPEEYDLAMGFDYIDHPNYIRVPLYYTFYTNKVSTDFERGECNPSSKPYFACFLVSNGGWNQFNDGAIKRNRMFHRLSLYKEVKSGGKYLNNTGGPIPHEETFNWLSKCKFTLYYENQTYPGYNTEKALLGYISGAVPIYYSHPIGLKELNTKAMILANDFEDEDALVEYIKKVDADDNLYCDIWNQNMIDDPNKNYEVLKEKVSNKIYKIIDTKVFHK